MLDRETKRKIDSARDILVGKVPDPKAQVEQITTALIYKFMDDMDRESQELGGKAKFFSGNYEKYGWSKLLDKRLSGAARLSLFTEAIARMPNNPHIPQLFRDIFKGAFLPYNDPETLSLFLKEINGFTYEHSETLGNAFEYLLSVLGSQGDAGQFRTPRHIIDFIVAVVDPGKDETILDPACGTAGFLISAYKHILAAGKKRPLTPAQKTRLMNSIIGYDIAPDMVKLSLVNMYLHDFRQPKILEYDALTSEKHWGEQFKVIMANPPFMTPKGGIRPHSHFSVRANRAEVLFVAYIMEHLSINGRAGVIVPEGIVFQAQNAHKKLRKMLVENSLFAVVSLPQGVFNPYSGVKTSILFLDNQRAKSIDEILFVNVENDGFDLGAKRNEIAANDLPKALDALEKWKQGKKSKNGVAFWVKKTKIAKSGDYNLIGSRYKAAKTRAHKQWPMVQLGTVAEIIAGQSPKSKYYNSEGVGTPFYQGKTEFGAKVLGNPVKWTTKITKLAQSGDILMSVRAPVGPVNITTAEICIGRGLAAIRAKEIDSKFLFYYLQKMQDEIKGSGGAVFDSISRDQIKKIRIPLPSPDIQQEIVEQIEVKQKAISHAKKIVETLERERESILAKRFAN